MQSRVLRSYEMTRKAARFTAIAACVCAHPARNLAIIRQIRLRHVLRELAVAPLVLAFYTLLQNALPAFGWNVKRAMESKDAPSAASDPLELRTHELPLRLLVILSQPVMAEWEERVFRKGTSSWPQAILRSLLFGFGHVPKGASLGAALTFSLAGLWFTRIYFRHGLGEAVIQHAAHNLLLNSSILAGSVAVNTSPALKAMYLRHVTGTP